MENRHTDEEDSRTSSIQTRKDLTQHKQEDSEISSQVHDEDDTQNLIQENSEILVLSAENIDDVSQETPELNLEDEEETQSSQNQETSQPHAEDDGETQQIQETSKLNAKSKDGTQKLVQENPETSGSDTEAVSKTQIEEKPGPSWADAVQETVNAVCGIISDSESSEEETTKPLTPTRPSDKNLSQNQSNSTMK